MLHFKGISYSFLQYKYLLKEGTGGVGYALGHSLPQDWQYLVPLMSSDAKVAVFNGPWWLGYGNTTQQLTVLSTWLPAGGTIWKVVKPLGSGASLEEVDQWEWARFLFAFCFLSTDAI